MKERYLKKILKNIDKTTLDNKTIVITGAAGGIGRETCLYLCHFKINLYICDIYERDLKNLRSEILSRDYNNLISLEIIPKDFTIKDQVLTFIDLLKIIKPDIIINNAGVYHREYKIYDDFEWTYLINTLVPAIVSNEMIKVNKNIKILNVGSVSYNWGNINFDDFDSRNEKNKTTKYAISKKTIMAESLYLKKQGFDVNIVHPGVSTTGLFARKNKAYPKLFYPIVVPLMKIVFISPAKAALPNVLACFIDYKDDLGWVGPSGLFHSYGFPKISLLNDEKLLDDEFLNKVHQHIINDIEKYKK